MANHEKEERIVAATLKDIAQKLGISITTVSRGLAGYNDVSEGTKKSNQTEAAEELGYQPNYNCS
jgi:LacI family transcriptional regulator